MKNFTSCFKEKSFLQFFLSRLRINDTGRYEDSFPYLSPCGRERNYVRCEDLPIVFTHVINDKKRNKYLFSYGHADDLLTHPFEPQKLFMPESGRIYHPAMDRVGGVGLVKSSFAIEISKLFTFEHNNNSTHEFNQIPTHFEWDAKLYKLTNELSAKFNK